jgi:hypothetical protein
MQRSFFKRYWKTITPTGLMARLAVTN